MERLACLDVVCFLFSWVRVPLFGQNRTPACGIQKSARGKKELAFESTAFEELAVESCYGFLNCPITPLFSLYIKFQLGGKRNHWMT